MNRRDFLGSVAGASVVAGVQASGLAQAARKVPTEPVLKIGYIPITDAAPLLIAHSRGMFEQAGIETEPPVLIQGWSELSMAFAHGVFNLSHLLSPIPIYLRYAKKIPVKVVAWDHVNNSAITVRQDDDIHDIGDLGGKRIAIPFWYSVHNIILQYAMRQHRLDAVIHHGDVRLKDNEVHLLEMAPPDMVFALKNKAIDGYIVAEPYNASGELQYGGRILRFSGDIWKNHACCQAVMHEQDIMLHPEWTQRVVSVLVEAEAWLKKNIEQAARILSRDGEKYIDLPDYVLQRAMTKYDLETYGPRGTGAIRHPEWRVNRVAFEPYPFKSYTRMLVELLRETMIDGDKTYLKELDTEFIVNDIVDYNLVAKALKRHQQTFVGGVDITRTQERPEVLLV